MCRIEILIKPAVCTLQPMRLITASILSPSAPPTAKDCFFLPVSALWGQNLLFFHLSLPWLGQGQIPGKSVLNQKCIGKQHKVYSFASWHPPFVPAYEHPPRALMGVQEGGSKAVTGDQTKGEQTVRHWRVNLTDMASPLHLGFPPRSQVQDWPSVACLLDSPKAPVPQEDTSQHCLP
jgi:hypothetical protein